MPGRVTYCWVGCGRLVEMKIEISEEGTVSGFIYNKCREREERRASWVHG
jgi:hypothetical protein